jgi:hypothetical protein
LPTFNSTNPFIRWGILIVAGAIGFMALGKFAQIYHDRVASEQAKAQQMVAEAELEANRLKQAPVRVVERTVEPRRLLPGMRFEFNPPLNAIPLVRSNGQDGMNGLPYNGLFSSDLLRIELTEDEMKLTVLTRRTNPEKNRMTFTPAAPPAVMDEFGNLLWKLSRVETSGHILGWRDYDDHVPQWSATQRTPGFDHKLPYVEFYGDETAYFYFYYKGRIFPYSRTLKFCTLYEEGGTTTHQCDFSIALNP